MLFEGTGLYFWLLFLVFLLVYITVKICLGNLFKKMRDKAWKGYIPFYSTYVLVKKLDLKTNVFCMSLIPFVNLYYYNIIIKKLLEAFAHNSSESIWYIIFPMYKFPELVFKNPIYVEKNSYELTNQFIAAQNELFNKPKEELPSEINLVDVNQAVEQKMDGLIINPTSFQQNLDTTGGQNQGQPLVQNDPNQIGTYINNPNNVYTNDSNNIYEKTVTEDEKKKVMYVEAKQEEKVEKPAMVALDKGEERVCPKCGTRLAPSATTCFMCGTVLD